MYRHFYWSSTMAEQTLIKPTISQESEKVTKARKYLEQARVFHERYLIRKNNTDLQDAISNYIDAVKYDLSINSFNFLFLRSEILSISKNDFGGRLKN